MYKEGTTYKTLTDGDKVFIMRVAFDVKAQSPGSLLKMTDKLITVNVVHSSVAKSKVDRSKKSNPRRILSRRLNALRSFKVHAVRFMPMPDWIDIARNLLKDSNRNLNIFFKDARNLEGCL